ncbi:MAG: endolytic transglycosylase MltG [Pseudomonadota bacterium]
MQALKTLMALLITVAALVVVAGVAGWLWFQAELAKDGPHGTVQDFTVSQGEGFSTVAERLQVSGVVHRSDVLRLQARLQGVESQIKAGRYQIPARASALAVLDQIVSGDVVQLRLTIPEGLTTAQILARVEATDVLTGDMPDTEFTEGIFLPDTYVFGEGLTRTQFLTLMQDAQTKLIRSLWPQRQAGLPYDGPDDALIMASIVEKETGLAGERAKIAGLFVGRLKKRMRLQTDPTVIYGVSGGEPLYNRRGERRTLFQSELDRVTPWNTYQIDGLPATPICNPGRLAIEAALNPADTDYVYFVADGKGGHLFAKTLAEHNRNVAAYRRYEDAEIARERSN